MRLDLLQFLTLLQTAWPYLSENRVPLYTWRTMKKSVDLPTKFSGTFKFNVLYAVFVLVISLLSADVGSAQPEENKSARAAADAQPAQPGGTSVVGKNQFQLSSTDQIFLKYTDNPIGGQVFRNTQWALLHTTPDYHLLQFFHQSFWKQILLNLSKIHIHTVKNFVAIQNLNMISYGPDLPPQDKKLIPIIAEVAVALGFTSQAINNMDIYVASSADQNAFTVSGNHDHIVVVINKPLLEKMSPSELKAIVAHELGHIRARHALMLQMHTIAISLIEDEMFPNEKSSGAHNSDALVGLHLIQGWYDQMLRSQSDRLNAHNNTSPSTFHTLQLLFSQSFESNDDSAQSINSFYNEFKEQLSRAPRKARREFLAQYIQELAIALNSEGTQMDIAQYFADLSQTMWTPQSALAPNYNQFLNNVYSALAALSRSYETTSDHYATTASGGPTALFYAMGRLSEQYSDSTDRAQYLKRFWNHYTKRIGSTSITEDTPVPILGLSSHPPIMLRSANILRTPDYPGVLFANPFMRLLLLETGMRARLDELKNISESDVNDESARKARLDELTKTEQLLESLDGDILKLIHERGPHIRTTDSTKKSNPRFKNTLQFYAFERLSRILTISELEKQRATLSSEPNNDSALSQIDTLIEKLNKELDALKDSKILSTLRDSYERKNNRSAYTQAIEMIEAVQGSMNPEALNKLLKTLEGPALKNESNESTTASTPQSSNKRGLGPLTPADAEHCMEILTGRTTRGLSN